LDHQDRFRGAQTKAAGVDCRDFGHPCAGGILNIDTAFDATKMTWLVGVHLVFVISTLLLALSDRLGADRTDA
jgi:hypothetical protein